MKVSEMMQCHPQVARPTQSLVAASRTMADVDCGVLPVLDEEQKLVGILTDRDICLALGRHSRPPVDISVQEAMSDRVHTIGAGGSVHSALETMKRHRVRRLPVLDGSGGVLGILSLDDVAAAARESAEGETDRPLFSEVAATLQVINVHQVPAL